MIMITKALRFSEEFCASKKNHLFEVVSFHSVVELVSRRRHLRIPLDSPNVQNKHHDK